MEPYLYRGRVDTPHVENLFYQYFYLDKKSLPSEDVLDALFERVMVRKHSIVIADDVDVMLLCCL